MAERTPEEIEEIYNLADSYVQIVQTNAAIDPLGNLNKFLIEEM